MIQVSTDYPWIALTFAMLAEHGLASCERCDTRAEVHTARDVVVFLDTHGRCEER